MEIPTARKLLRRIERRAFRPEWFEEDAIQLLMDLDEGKGTLWYRHPDSDKVLKISVEELPREQWPTLRP